LDQVRFQVFLNVGQNSFNQKREIDARRLAPYLVRMDGMKYTKYGIAFGMVIITLGVALSIKYGYRPAPARIMKPSFFEKPEQIGAVAMKRFYAQLASEHVVVLGLPTNRDWSADVAKGFVQASFENQRAPVKIFVEAKLPDHFKAAIQSQSQGVPILEIETNTQTMAALGDAVSEALASKQRILVVVPSLYSSHLLEGNPINRLESLIDIPGQKEGTAAGLFSITVGPLALEAAQEVEIDPICMGSERDGSGTAALGCAILMAGRPFYRKRVLDSEPEARSRYVAIMQSPRPKDFLLLVRTPTKPN
jgi:hypothetical protein